MPSLKVPFDSLQDSDLYLDAIYEGGRSGNAGDDPIFRLLPVGNQGGFRVSGRSGGHRLAVLYSSLADPDWPDQLDLATGQFTYYGDNKRSGSGLSMTARGGNKLLEQAFAAVHADPPRREAVPPFFLFTKTGQGRSVAFRGLAVPGYPGVLEGADLVAVWRSVSGARFQNYRGVFTVLDVARIERTWINQLQHGVVLGDACPPLYRDWVVSGGYTPLRAPNTRTYRTSVEQLPAAGRGLDLLRRIYGTYAADPYAFEGFAARVWALAAGDALGHWELTRAYRDGGRDAIGTYLLGPAADRIAIEFALEAKCYAPRNGVGVREVSRLISRIRHREFGVFVTTSYVAAQAYQEIRDDGHPIVIISGADIVEILRGSGIATQADLDRWISAESVVPA